jgi:hypothetical protein
MPSRAPRPKHHLWPLTPPCLSLWQRHGHVGSVIRNSTEGAGKGHGSEPRLFARIDPACRWRATCHRDAGTRPASGSARDARLPRGDFRFEGGYPAGDTADKLFKIPTLSREIDVYQNQLMRVSDAALDEGLRAFGATRPTQG